MKKLLLLSALLIFACSSDDSSNDDNSNQTFLERYADVVWENDNEYRFSLNLNGYTQGDDTSCEEYIWGQETDGFITFNILENNYDNLVVSLSADSVIYQVVYEVSTDENIITTSIFSDEDVIIDTSTASRTSLLVPCNDDDNIDPDPVEEIDVITTMTVTLTPDNGSTAVVLEYIDLDGEGGEVPIITVYGDLTAGSTYNGSILVLNETEDPAENLSEEIEEEGDEHQFFFVVGGGLDVTTSYNDADYNGNPVGLSFYLTAGYASVGDFTVTLIHEPTKPNTGINDAGGSTDIEVTFPITIE